jgi:hypothetical protein
VRSQAAERAPVVLWAATRGRDLVVQLREGEAGEGSMLVLLDGDTQPRCLALPEAWTGQRPLVTTEGLWLRQPFGLEPWEEVEAAVRALADREAAGPPAAAATSAPE